MHELLLAELRAANLLDFSCAAVDSSHIRAMKGGPATGPSPVDRGKTGSKHHVIVEADGVPLATILTGGNRNDVTQLLPLIEAVPPATAPVRRPRLRPRGLSRPGPRRADHPAHRPARHRTRLRPRRLPLGRGRSDRFAALVSPPAHPLGDPRRHPPGVRHPRLRHHLLAAPARIRRLGGGMNTLFHSV